jgi:L-2,4-diaminobutyrate decarboxylase
LLPQQGRVRTSFKNLYKMNDQQNHAFRNTGHQQDPHLHTYLFSGLQENRAYYQKSILQSLQAVTGNLETRQTPFSGASLTQIKEKFNGVLLDEHEDGLSLQASLEELKELYLNDAIHFHDPRYAAHLNCPVLIPALAAEVIISSLNSSMDTWDQSAGATFIELRLIAWTLGKIGYPAAADGVFTSGGTQSNLMGLLLARDHYIKTKYGIDPKTEGLPAEASRFRVFCSEASHFSLKKSASLLGLGQKCIVPVAVDADYKMDVRALLEAIALQLQLGNIPIAIVGTAGTTDFGAIDPLTDLAAIARQYQLWFHVDAAYGGGLVLSDRHAHKLKGIEHSDSTTIDYHKTFFQPVSSSGFFMRDKRCIDYISYHADYLNSREQEEEGIPNMVKKSIQTTRRFDALKLWMTLRTMGRRRLGSYIDEIIALAQQTAVLLRRDPDFELLHQPEISALVFRYAPPGARVELTEGQLSDLNLAIRKAMFNEGKALVAGTRVNQEVYLKFTLLNPLTTITDIQDIIKIIKRHGKEYLNQHLLPSVSEAADLQYLY